MSLTIPYANQGTPSGTRPRGWDPLVCCTFLCSLTPPPPGAQCPPEPLEAGPEAGPQPHHAVRRLPAMLRRLREALESQAHTHTHTLRNTQLCSHRHKHLKVSQRLGAGKQVVFVVNHERCVLLFPWCSNSHSLVHSVSQTHTHSYCTPCCKQ